MRGTPRVREKPGSGGGGISYGGFVVAGHPNQILYIDNSGNLASDANFTTDSTHYNISRSAGGNPFQFQIDGMLFGFPLPGGGNIYTTSDGKNVHISGDGTGIGQSKNWSASGFINTSGNGQANTFYNYDGSSPSIVTLAQDSAGSLFQTEITANGLLINGNYLLPTIDGSAGYVLTTDGFGGVTWQAGGGGASGLPAVLGIDNTNNGISIFGSDLLKASKETTVLFNNDNIPIISTDGNYNVSLQGVSNAVASQAYLGFNSSGMPYSHGLYSTYQNPFTFSGSGPDDLTVSGTYNGSTSSVTVAIDSNDSYIVEATPVGGSSFTNNTMVFWPVSNSATIQNYASGTTFELTNCTTAPMVGDVFDDGGGNSATITSVTSGPFDTFSYAGPGFNFFVPIVVHTNIGPYNGFFFNFNAATGHTITDNWTSNATSASFKGFKLGYSDGQFGLGDLDGALTGSRLFVDVLNENLFYTGGSGTTLFEVSVLNSASQLATNDGSTGMTSSQTANTASLIGTQIGTGYSIDDTAQKAEFGTNPTGHGYYGLSIDGVNDTIFLSEDSKTSGFFFYGNSAVVSSGKDGFIVNRTVNEYSMGIISDLFKINATTDYLSYSRGANKWFEIGPSGIIGSGRTMRLGDPAGAMWETTNDPGLVANLIDASATFNIIDSTATPWIKVEPGVSGGNLVIGDGVAVNTLTFGSNPQTILKFASSTGYFHVSLPSNVPLFGVLGQTETIILQGGVVNKYTGVSATYSILSSDYVIDCTSGTFTATLPTAIADQGRVYVIKNSGAGIITLATTGGQTIDSLATLTLTAGQRATVQSNGANWIVIG